MSRASGTHFSSYSEVLSYLEHEHREKHLLLGNGFSIAYNPTIFSYNALQNKISDPEAPLLKKLFSVINTSNFEVVMREIDTLIEIARAFGAGTTFIESIQKASSELKIKLISTIEAMHPEHVYRLPESEVENCGKFLSPYLDEDEKGKIFSTNYDLLLYWVLMRYEKLNGDKFTAYDGFGRERIDDGDEKTPTNDRVYSDLIWGSSSYNQNIYYLHGALHLFDNQTQVIKEEYDGEYIMRKIHSRIENGHYPIFVTAGNGDQKLSHIMHSSYLSNCYAQLKSITGSLVTLGFGFGEYDDHIIAAINSAASQPIAHRLRSVFIGVFTDADKSHVSEIKGKFRCKINTFDAKTVNIWRA